MKALLFAALTTLSVSAQAESYKPYALDLKPFEKHSALYSEWQKLKEGKGGESSEASLTRQFQILTEMNKLEPEWIDGYWMLGENAFILADPMTDLKKAREVFVQGRDATETCLKKQADNPLCKMFLGASLGKIASIDGIFSSLKQAKRVHDLWIDVTKSGVNHPLSSKNTLQGAARYALGIFYRLVPDFFAISWLYDVKGDIKKSVTFHEEAISIDPPGVCSSMMLGVSLICSVKGDVKAEAGQRGLKYLADAKTLPITNGPAKSCQADISKIEKDPDLACGYETSRQQETSEEEYKKANGEAQKS